MRPYWLGSEIFGLTNPFSVRASRVLSPGAPVNITVWSYVDQLGVAVLTDDQTFKDPHEATDALIAAFAELHSAAGLSDQDTGLDLAAEHALR
jgi:diacylglycerol O-acyltransferase